MALSFCIVDDDPATRAMLENIIKESQLGEVIGTARGGEEGTRIILETHPDVVLIDWLMPDQDGLETITQLKRQGYHGKYVMISQIENQEMVGEAYQSGIEFFIRKPINRIEVESVLSRVSEHTEIKHYLNELKSSLSKLDTLSQISPYTSSSTSVQPRTVDDMVRPIYMNLGIVGESGCGDLTAIMEILLEQQGKPGSFPPLRQLYEAAASRYKHTPREVDKEAKAIEQRIRRTVTTALNHLASIGLTDYGNPKFEHYAPLYFDFEDIRAKMKEIDEERDDGKSKVSIKKFLQVLYLEALDQMKNR
ncbi:response regulator [Paenibacillus nicotianae]|uniref:Response regulator n=1 Tax=Paenibacillus nicotianae TaxID=1526551 RepID=A0ABW4V1F3_9BACL